MKLKDLNDLPETSKYIARIGAETRSLLKAVVTEKIGNYFTDIAIIRFDRSGDIEAPPGYEPSPGEIELIKAEFEAIDWPSSTYINLNDNNIPEIYTNADPKDRFEFYDLGGNIVMLQVKIVKKGEKSYVPITKWSDGEYRFAEPENKIPLFGLETIKDHTTVFINEGANAARICAMISRGEGEYKNHPWQKELSEAASVGFIGGALSPLRTDWSVLKRKGITRAYIIADNDAPGRSAVPKIAKELNCPTYVVQFTDQFPTSFDIADPFPESMFTEIEGHKYYNGPSFRECLHPATWSTNLVEVLDENTKKVKKVPVLRNHFKTEWSYIEEYEFFINNTFPEIIRKPAALDSMLRPFSDSKSVSDLLLQSYTGRTPKLTYRPDIKGRRVTANGETAINTYVPPTIKPQAGDVTKWNDYLSYLIPDETECYQFKRWCATLIARPDIRMSFAVLLVSNETGIGKSTVGEKVLAPIIGMHNTTFPSETDIVDSPFNSWLKGKRLAVVHEIYSGSSFKAVNKLKSFITDKFVEINEKFMVPMRMENFVHILACSNSENALKIDSKDRRWFVPTVSEDRWPPEKWAEFLSWLSQGGLSIIAHWAETWTDYVLPGERAPMTKRKETIIDDSRSLAEREAIDLFTSINLQGIEVALASKEFFEWAIHKVKGSVYDKEKDLQKLAKERGFLILNNDNRMFLRGALQTVIVSPRLAERIKDMSKEDMKEAIKKAVTHPEKIIQGLI